MEDRVHGNYTDSTNRSEVSLESLKLPQQESGDQKLPAADEESLMHSILENPKLLEELRKKLKKPDPSKLRKLLQTLFGFFQWVACGCPSLTKAIFACVLTRLLALFTMQLEIRKEKREEIDKLQDNLKTVNETHEKVAEKVGEIEDKIKGTRVNDYKISSTESKDLEIKLIRAERDLGNCEDNLSDVQEDIESLKAVFVRRIFLQVIGIVFTAALAAVVMYYFIIGAFTLRCNENDDDVYCTNQQLKSLVWFGLIMTVGCLATVIGAPLKWMIESLSINSTLTSECEKVLKDDLQKVKRVQKKLKRAVEKELPQMKKNLVVLECDVSRYASLQKLNSD